jgi:predicted transcriptional regulator
MPQVSEAVVNRVFDVLIEASEPITSREVATQLNLHPTTTSDALRQLIRRDVAQRTLGKSTHGHPPYLYTTTDTAPAAVAVAASRDSNRSRPASKDRATRGAMTDLVRNALPRWTPNGRGFTIDQMHERVGVGSYETVRKALAELIESGEVEETGKCRKRHRLYRPVDKAASTPTPTPVGAPAPTPSLSFTQLDEVLAERDESQTRMAADEVRLAEIGIALDGLRARLA